MRLRLFAYFPNFFPSNHPFLFSVKVSSLHIFTSQFHLTHLPSLSINTTFSKNLFPPSQNWSPCYTLPGHPDFSIIPITLWVTCSRLPPSLDCKSQALKSIRYGLYNMLSVLIFNLKNVRSKDFLQKVWVLLCARHCTKHWEQSSKKEKFLKTTFPHLRSQKTIQWRKKNLSGIR